MIVQSICRVCTPLFFVLDDYMAEKGLVILIVEHIVHFYENVKETYNQELVQSEPALPH